jgi:APA family basic amino acid/polyamine antiporter
VKGVSVKISDNDRALPPPESVNRKPETESGKLKTKNLISGVTPKPELSLLDSTCIIVGIIIGAGIYETAPTVAACLGSPINILSVWLLGGFLALAGSLCYAELATAIPQEGGDYVYLTRAYGPWVGFLFGWSQLAVVRPGDIALMAFIFARYASQLFPLGGISQLFYAGAAVVVLTGINILGVKSGKWTQNLLTLAKIGGMLAIIVVGFSAPALQPVPVPSSPPTWGGLDLALILVMFTFGGWNEMAYVAAEIKNPRRNIVRGLVTGTTAVTVLYLLINGAFLSALGPGPMAASKAVAVDATARVFPAAAGRAIAILICISALGAVNGLIFTGARISYALGAGHTIFRPLGIWHPRLQTPVWALVIQGALSLAIIFLAGSFLSTIIYSAPMVWLFFLGTALSVFVLRRRVPELERPYKINFYPLPPIIFALCCLFMLFSSITYALAQVPWGLLLLLGVILIGAIIYVITEQ